MSKTFLKWSSHDVWEGQVKFLMEEDGMSEAAAQADASSDQDLYTFAWADLCEALTGEMGRVNPHDRKWKAEVNGFGWRSQSGWKTFRASNGRELLQSVLPDTECAFRIDFDYRRHTITINNAHHDRPMGGEIYTIWPMTQREEENER